MGNTQTRHEKNSSSNNSRAPKTKRANRSRSSAAIAGGQGFVGETATAASLAEVGGEGFLVRLARDNATPSPRQHRNSGGGPSISEPSARRRCCQRSSSTAIELQQARRPQSAAQSHQQSSSQLSTWSLGSLSGGAHLNWSFSAAVRNSFRHRNKSTRKSLTSLQGSRRSKTQWHRPLTNSIFSTHFKEISRNDDFCIDQLVAKGAFGVVFKVSAKQNSSLSASTAASASTSASASSSNKTKTATTCYALKVLKKSKLIEDNSVKQIKDEADIQRICGHHPFIVQQFDLWQNRYNLHILSEYVPNGELFSKIAYFSLDLVRLYLAEIALAIDFLHNAGIIYRDAKPENILLTHNFHIKLTDFGLSKWLKLGVTTKTMCGTFKYMAPEILRGDAYGHAVDWWALGVIVCQMLTQKTPNIKRYLALTLVSPATVNDASRDVAANDEVLSRVPSIANINGCLMDRQVDFLPDEVEQLCHEAKDVVQRLLELNPRQRLRSVMALQRIAMYKDFKVESQHLLSIAPLDIIAKDQIHIFDDHVCEEISSAEATKAFQCF